MKHVIQIHISRGKKYYVAEGVDIPIVTQGKTLDELQKNLKEAIGLYFEGENLATLGFAPRPSVLASFEFEPVVYAKA